MFTTNDEHIEYTIREIVSAISERQAGIRGETKKPNLLAQMTMVALSSHFFIPRSANIGPLQQDGPSPKAIRAITPKSKTEAAAPRSSNGPSESELQNAQVKVEMKGEDTDDIPRPSNPTRIAHLCQTKSQVNAQLRSGIRKWPRPAFSKGLVIKSPNTGDHQRDPIVQ